MWHISYLPAHKIGYLSYLESFDVDSDNHGHSGAPQAIRFIRAQLKHNSCNYQNNISLQVTLCSTARGLKVIPCSFNAMTFIQMPCGFSSFLASSFVLSVVNDVQYAPIITHEL